MKIAFRILSKTKDQDALLDGFISEAIIEHREFHAYDGLSLFVIAAQRQPAADRRGEVNICAVSTDSYAIGARYLQGRACAERRLRRGF